jgi:hypothetical protein
VEFLGAFAIAITPPATTTERYFGLVGLVVLVASILFWGKKGVYAFFGVWVVGVESEKYW